MFFEDNIDDSKYCGHLYGLGTSSAPNGASSYENHHGYGPPQNAINSTNTSNNNGNAGEPSGTGASGNNSTTNN